MSATHLVSTMHANTIQAHKLRNYERQAYT